MRVFEADIITGIERPVITLGAFDGVHRGHSMLLRRLREKAAELGGESVVVTFLPHPRLFLGKFSGSINFLTSHEEKLMLLEKAGVDNTVVLRFDEELSRMEACDFVSQVLAGRMGMQYLIVGFNHRFGRGGSGEFGEIAECARRVGFGVERVGGLETDSGIISSTAIREALGKGELAVANSMLGYDYFMRGTIVEGRKLGRSIGFPTANVSTSFAHKLLPADGVYVVAVQFNGSIFHGMANIGHRPTVNTTGEPRSVEVHIFGFSETIYGQSVTLSFIHRLRDEFKFESVDALKNQLVADRQAAEAYLRNR